MKESTKQSFKIMIIEDEEDILTLYSDYLCSRGHKVLKAYLKANNILEDIDKECPDIFLIDYRLPGNKNGIEIAVEILNKFPSANILFITAYELLDRELLDNRIFDGKNIQVLLKPIKLHEIENSMVNLVNKN